MRKKKNFHSITDEDTIQWWRALQRGDERALHSLYHTYRDDLFHYGRRIVKGDELILNSIQELFLYLWHSRERLSEARSVKAYLISSLRRILLNEVRKQQPYSFSLTEHEEGHFAEFSIEDVIILDEQSKLRSELITQLLNTLTARQREIIYLKYYEELSINEIAALLAINYQSVINHLQRAYITLRNNTTPEQLSILLLTVGVTLVIALL